RAMRSVVLPGVSEIESVRQIVIDLDGAELPFTAEDVADDEVNLRSVKGRFTRLFAEFDAKGGGSIAAGRLRLVPVRSLADVLRRIEIAQADADAILSHAERAKDDLDDLEATGEFIG